MWCIYTLECYPAIKNKDINTKPRRRENGGRGRSGAEVVTTEPKMEEESGAPCLPSSNGAPGPKGEEQPTQSEKKKEKNIKRGGNHFAPYANTTERAFITNIPFDVKWQLLKDLVKEKVGEVMYVELLMDVEQKSRGCAVVEFKMEESMKEDAEVLNKPEWKFH